MPKDRILAVDDHRFEMIVKEGKMYWVPISENEGMSISGYGR